MSETTFFEINGNFTPQAERHTSLVSPPKEAPCWLDYDFKRSPEEICNHVRNNQACTSLVYYINYLTIFICYLNPNESVFGQIVTCLAICLLFILFVFALYYVANNFAVPNAVMLAEYFQVNSQHYGASVITILDSIPKLISVLFVCNSGDEVTNGSLMLAVIFGKLAGIFALGIAIIGFRKHFRIKRVYFLIDSGMLLFGYAYFASIIFVKHEYDMNVLAANDESSDDIFLLPHAIVMLVAYVIFLIVMLAKVLKPAITRWHNMDQLTRKNKYQPVAETNNLKVNFTRFWQAFNPYKHIDEVSRWFFYVTVPVWCILRAILCVADLKRPLHDWCKPLKIMNILLSSVLVIDFISPHIAIFVIAVSTIWAVMVAFMTQQDGPPMFHWLFALHGLIFSFIVYNVISWEFHGLIFQISEYFFDWNEDVIGILCLALFFIASELMLCWKFMDNGNYEVAYGLVIGLTILTLYTALPLLIFSMCTETYIKVTITANVHTAHIFISIMLVLGLFAILLTGYEIRASISTFLFSLFCLLFYYILLSSSETVHPYGTKHHTYYYTDIFEGTWA